MTNKIIADTLKEINQAHHYFHNRIWQPLLVNMEPLEMSELTPIPFLQSLAILDSDGAINPLLQDAGFFLSFLVINDEIEQYVPRPEILVSTLGLMFLKSMNEKLFMREVGHAIV